MSARVSAAVSSGRFDSAARRQSLRHGRERGCWVYIAAEQFVAAGLSPDDPPPLYRTWAGERGRFIVTLYPSARREPSRGAS